LSSYKGYNYYRDRIFFAQLIQFASPPPTHIIDMDLNAFTAPFQATKTLHRDVYPTIDPQNPNLSAKGKTILITGAAGGIGGARLHHTILIRTHANASCRKLREPGQSLVQKALYLLAATKRA
jgi:hypothetical protein